MGFSIAFSGILSWQLMAVLLLVYAGLAVADLFKRHLLSNPVVYWATMLIAPFAALTAIIAPIIKLLDELGNEKTNWGKIILLFIGGAALLLLAAVVYIRGHIAPIDKASEKYESNKNYFAAKRLISVGMAGNILYGIFLAISFIEITDLIFTVGYAVSGMPIQDIIILPFFLLFLLFVPIANVIVIFILIFVAVEFVTLGVTAFMTLMFVMLIANGCIRYILTTDMTKGKKALWIFLSLIPVFNFVYGIKCLTKINKRLKETQFS